MNQKLFIAFDYDGTLINTFWLIQEYFEDGAVELGLQHLTAQDFRYLHQYGWKALFQTKGVNLWQAYRLLRYVQRRINQELPDLRRIPANIIDLVGDLHAAGHTLAIVSSSGATAINASLDTAGIKFAFTEVLGNQPIWGKAHSLRQLRYNYPGYARYVYVGDEIRDAQAAKQAEYVPLSVDWGIHHHALLAQYNNKIFKTPAQLFKHLTQTPERV
jgi:phosphoglycolate phosphatase